MSFYAFFKGWLLLSLTFNSLNYKKSFSLKKNLETLASNLGFFPFEYESYHP